MKGLVFLLNSAILVSCTAFSAAFSLSATGTFLIAEHQLELVLTENGDEVEGELRGPGFVFQVDGVRDGSEIWGTVEGTGGVGFSARLSPRGDVLAFLVEDGKSQVLNFNRQKNKLDPGAVLSQAVGNQGVGGGAQKPLGGARRKVSINKKQLTDAQVGALEQQLGGGLQDGAYWYDKGCGVWGLEGGPGLGIVAAGIDVGAPLQADASGGQTGVYVNGRQLHYYDVLGLQNLLGGPLYQGRYWIDAQWNAGLEGGPALVNLAQQLRASQGGGGWKSKITGASGNSNGSGGYIMGRDASGKSWGASYGL